KEISMKRLRLVGLSFALLLLALAEARPAFAACGVCTTDRYCQSCTGDGAAWCFRGRCAL
ncbi:MAG TPA: hypothetical protein VIW92_06840, partial [Thermoanaerobaculia bacterium]